MALRVCADEGEFNASRGALLRTGSFHTSGPRAEANGFAFIPMYLI